MIHGVLYREDNRKILIPDVMKTSNPLERMRGLLGRTPLRKDQGLIIAPCSSVHTFGMTYPIDLIFLNKHWKITKLVHLLKPCRLAWSWKAFMVIELRGGVLNELELTSESRLMWEKNTCI